MTHLRKAERWLIAAVLIAAPLAGLVGGLLTQDYGGDIGRELEYVAANPSRWLVANYFTLLMGTLMTVVIAILVAIVRERAAALGYVGGALAFIGIYFHGSVVGYSLVQAPLVGGELPQDGVLAFAETDMYTHVAFTTMLIPFLGFFLGMILLALALWRARTAPMWVAGVMAVAPLTEFVGYRGSSPELMYILFAVAFAYLAARVLRGGDALAAVDVPVVETERSADVTAGPA